jgi:hypothetical protein
LPVSAQNQVTQYKQGRNGLASHGADDGPDGYRNVTRESYKAAHNSKEFTADQADRVIEYIKAQEATKGIEGLRATPISRRPRRSSSTPSPQVLGLRPALRRHQRPARHGWGYQVTALLKALAPYRKAVLSGLIAADFAALSVAPGGITLAEAGVILGAFATGAGIVFKVPNVPKAE